MYVAVSLKTGEYVEAISANYKATRNLLLVCPECGDPVQFKFRQIPRDTPFFAHPKENESVKSIKACSLRIDGGQFQKASSVVPGISHGQLVNRFQREFCKELYESLGPAANTLYEFIRDSNFERLDHGHYRSLVGEIRSGWSERDMLTKELSSIDWTIFKGGTDDVCLFLDSPYGKWVGNFLYQAAYFVACVIHQVTLRGDLGRCIFHFSDTAAVFVADPMRIEKSPKYATEILSAGSKRNLAITQIAKCLVGYQILRWRFKGTPPSLFVVFDSPSELSAVSFVSAAARSKTPEETPKLAKPYAREAKQAPPGPEKIPMEIRGYFGSTVIRKDAELCDFGAKWMSHKVLNRSIESTPVPLWMERTQNEKKFAAKFCKTREESDAIRQEFLAQLPLSIRKTVGIA